MYVQFYGFREKPFNLTPNPRFVYLSRSHREAFAHLLYGINNRAGFIALTGEVGSGKTTALRALLTQLDPGQYRTAFIFNPCLSPPELLHTINREFGVPQAAPDGSSQLDILNQFLLRQNAEGRTVVLVIDEAQNLDAPVLEQIRLISNLETEREKLIQIVLSGQPEFAEVLKRKEMRQLSQRITVRYHLQPMDLPDTVDYIHHRVEVAGGKAGRIFSQGALKKIYRYSGGLPRLTNVACDRSLLAGYTLDRKNIDSRVVRAGIRDMKRNMGLPRRIPGVRLIPALALVILLFAGGIYFAGKYMEGPKAAEQAAIQDEGQPKRYPIPAGEAVLPGLAAELGKVPGTQSARVAFNSLAAFWSVSPFPESGDRDFLEGIEGAALERHLRLYRFTGKLDALLRFGYPAALELDLPGLGKRFISVMGKADDRLLIEPPLGGATSLSPAEIEKHWSGQAFLLWKDPLGLFSKLWPGTKGTPSRQLQELLREAGAYLKSPTGVYDRETYSAVKEFQASRGIRADGIAGGQTLMLLYASIERFRLPQMTMGNK